MNNSNLLTKFNYFIQNDCPFYDGKVIGVLQEKTLHRIIKNLYEDNQLYQEIKVDSFYVDILRDNNIIEIQTKQFNKLRDKVAYLLSLNKYKINIVYPVFTKKMIYNLKNNEIINVRKSPKSLKYPEVFFELYKIKQLLIHNDLTITLLLLEIDEYRQIINTKKGYICYDRVPKNLINEIVLENKKDYLQLLPSDLSEKFTAFDISKLTKCDIKYVNKMLNVMVYIGIVEVIGKIGRKNLYIVKKG